MEGQFELIDTPKKALVQSRSTALRTALKEFEHTFAAEHDGRKPSKNDIKTNSEIAQKYKEYNKTRDVLAGTLGISALDAPSPTTRRKSQPGSVPPDKHRSKSTPQRKRLRPEDIDPYDPPISVTPHRVISAIGPTPQRDGQVLGIFDLLSNPGSGRSITATPSSKKRRIEAKFGFDEDVGNQPLVTQTPSRRSEKTRGDILDHLTGTPVSQLKTSRHNHSRTPVSDGKKFMLSQFFATPVGARYGRLGEGPAQSQQIASTPLRDRVLGKSPGEGLEREQGKDATPAYLRRSYSFKDRLLSASATHSHDGSSDAEASSQSSTRARPGRVGGRSVKFMPKPLSQIAAEMRQREDARHDDDLDAMREMEEGDSWVAGDEKQSTGKEQASIATEATGQKTWKKKGQKRTTRRFIMRPSRIKPKADQEDRVEERARPQPTPPPTDSVSQENSDAQPAQPPACADDESDAYNDVSDEDDDKPSRSKVKGPRRSNPDAPLQESSTRRPPAKASAKASKKKDTFNPNTTAHMNFRSLKIKNKNSKAKGRGGRGRFGRR